MNPANSPVEALERIERLLALEQAEDLLEYQRQVLETPLKERQRRGVSWFPVRIHHTRMATGGKYVLEIHRDMAFHEPHQFQTGNQAALFCRTQVNGKTPQLAGTVIRVDTQVMELQIFEDDLPDWIDERSLGVDLLFDENSYREMKAALEKVKKAPEKSRLQEIRDVLLGFKPAHYQEKAEIPIPQHLLGQLNESQLEAIRRVGKASDVFCIHGPPGTGKTTTLIGAVETVLSVEKQVLVCAPSNAAADLLTEKIAARGMRVLRVGNPARISDSIVPYTLDAMLAGHTDAKEIKRLRKMALELKRMAYAYKKYYDRSEREQKQAMLKEARAILDQIRNLEGYILDQAKNQTQVFVCTLVGAALPLIRDKQFSCVFIDEAGQALEPATWIPIIRAKKVVFAGDHCQLPPTVKSKEAARAGLEETLMEKWVALGNADLTVMLNMQYRMHQTIMGFSSDYFYKGELNAAPAVANRTFPVAASQNLPPLVFLDTAGTGFDEKFHPETVGLSNPEEGALLFRHLLHFLPEIETSIATESQNLELAIISPYREQVEWLKTQVKSLGPEKQNHRIRCGTVDGFQGQEADLVYISLVRSNDRSEIGFLRDIRRMNVAITRARKRLVVVGDSATISQHPFYGKLLRYIEAHAGYESAWSYPAEG
jgi:ATP-dependent RNA/DNA helicase IGHMBP2